MFLHKLLDRKMNLADKLILHVGAGLDEGATNDDEPAQQVSVNAALLFFVVLARLDLAVVD
jgi:hypothetical protein